MTIYLDASALVKRYIAEVGTREVNQLFAGPAAIGTSIITHAEVAAALGKATRLGLLARDEAHVALHVFRIQWPSLIRLQVTENIASHAGTLAWEHGLRGFDAVHLSAALQWQENVYDPVTFAAFDRRLWQAAQAAGLGVWPEDLGAFTGQNSPSAR
jgi:predicted nucleic acid-binding protein